MNDLDSELKRIEELSVEDQIAALAKLVDELEATLR